MTLPHNNPSLSQLPPEFLRRYKGGHSYILNGYCFELSPRHPAANPMGFVPQHRLVMERVLGRFLTPKEDVHHKNQIRHDNRKCNLQVCSRSEHLRIHRAMQRQQAGLPPLTKENVQKALQETGGLKKAAAKLGLHPETIRIQFPDILEPFRRKSPAQIDDLALIERVRLMAADSSFGYREIAQACGIASMTVKRLCDKHKLPWVKKSKVGEVHKTYRRKTTIHAE